MLKGVVHESNKKLKSNQFKNIPKADSPAI